MGARFGSDTARECPQADPRRMQLESMQVVRATWRRYLGFGGRQQESRLLVIGRLLGDVLTNLLRQETERADLGGQQ
jgi:hypothetical protein